MIFEEQTNWSAEALAGYIVVWVFVSVIWLIACRWIVKIGRLMQLKND